MSCPGINTNATEQGSFWSDVESGTLQPHEIGWIVAGSTAAFATIVSLFTFFMYAPLHARNYYRPLEQRQILRILLMPAVYGIVSFFSYRYYRAYTYYQVSLTIYEALVIAAFLYLLLDYIGSSNEDQRKVLLEKEKRKLPFPFNCIRFRPGKPYFAWALKWSVLQYCIFRPIISIIGIITNALGVYCATEYSVHYAAVYLDAVDFVSITVALYGLIVFYALVKDRLKGRSPLAKFLSIKLIIFFAFYQGFVFDILQSHGVIKGTTYWSAYNVADGLQALATCCEMVIFSFLMMWSFNWKEYRRMRPAGAKHTSIWRPIWDCFNYGDFLYEAWLGIAFTWGYIRNKEGTHAATDPLFRAKYQSGFDLYSAYNFPNNRYEGNDTTKDTAPMTERHSMTDYPHATNPDDIPTSLQAGGPLGLSHSTSYPPHDGYSRSTNEAYPYQYESAGFGDQSSQLDLTRPTHQTAQGRQRGYDDYHQAM